MNDKERSQKNLKQPNITDEQIKQAFAQLNPTEEQKMQMLQKIKPGGRRRHFAWRAGAAAAIIVAAITVSGVGIDAATGGNAWNAIQEFWGWNQESEDIVVNTEEIRQKGVEVYAPEIFALDADTILFGNQGGIIVYDRQKEELAAAIDVQSIDAIYFNSDQKKTHVLKKENLVYIFNTDNGKVFGDYYAFDLEQENTGNLAVSDTGKDQETLKTLYEEWEEKEQQYRDTFSEFSDAEFMTEAQKETAVMYSERSLLWEDAEEKSYISCLLFDGDNQYVLYSAELTAASNIAPVQEDILNLQNDERAAGEQPVSETGLPEFQYTGEDPVERAVYEYLKEEERDERGEGNVQIPMIRIIARKQKGAEEVLFLSYGIYEYTQTGQMLENVSGGSCEACIHLKKSGEKYEVTAMERAKDGGLHDESIREMTSGYPGVYRAFKKDAKAMTDEKCKEWIRENITDYVKKNHLDIKYYKDFGWDPVPISK